MSLALLCARPRRGGARHIVARNVVVYRRTWPILITGFFEPFFYLLSIDLGLSHLVGPLPLAGRMVSYARFVAPGLLATSAMNGAIFDSTFNLFYKLKVAKTYESVLATPLGVRDVALGELLWSMLRSGLYAGFFLAVMAGYGDVVSPWAALAFPGALLVAFAFASLGMAGTSYMRTWDDFDKVTLATVPLFLFSGTFFPLTVYPGWLQEVVRCTPLYQGVALLRSLDAGQFDLSLVSHGTYLVLLGATGYAVTARRLSRLLAP
jgi:lipooligosaccharide transport system permease protein